MQGCEFILIHDSPHAPALLAWRYLFAWYSLLLIGGKNPTVQQMEKLRLAPPSSKLFRKREFTRTVTNTIVIHGPTRPCVAVGICVQTWREENVKRGWMTFFSVSCRVGSPHVCGSTISYSSFMLVTKRGWNRNSPDLIIWMPTHGLLPISASFHGLCILLCLNSSALTHDHIHHSRSY